MSEVRNGDRVEIHYTGRLEDGHVFDSSRDREPLQFTAGSEQLIPGVSQGVLGMAQGESKTLTIPPADGYGDHRPDLVQEIPRSALPENVEVGDPLRATSEEEEITVWVKELSEESAVIDANHPLAGRTLIFDVEIVSVSRPTS